MNPFRAPWILALAVTGCVALFGWDIHAPGLVSNTFYQKVEPAPRRVALYLPDSLAGYVSKNRGGRLADPQTYHVGEALAPILVEAFQQAFEEFIFLEVEPAPDVLAQYGIPYLAVVEVAGFKNRVDLKGQAVSLTLKTRLFDTRLNPLAEFESRGVSDAKKVFAKKGGPEVNLNSAVENSALSLVQYLQDWMAGP